MPSLRSSIAAASPAGPAPTTRTSTFTPALRGACPRARRRSRRPSLTPCREQAGHRGSAEEALAAAVQYPGPAPQPVDVRGRQRAGQRVPALAAGPPLAVADDPAVRRVGGDPGRVLIRPGAR